MAKRLMPVEKIQLMTFSSSMWSFVAASRTGYLKENFLHDEKKMTVEWRASKQNLLSGIGYST